MPRVFRWFVTCSIAVMTMGYVPETDINASGYDGVLSSEDISDGSSGVTLVTDTEGGPDNPSGAGTAPDISPTLPGGERPAEEQSQALVREVS